MKIAVLVIFLLLLPLVPLGVTVSAQGDAAAVTTSTISICNPGTNPFIFTGAAWGTTGVPVSVGPGSDNVPLTVTLLYEGVCSLTIANFKLGLSYPFAGANGASNLTAYETNVAPDATISETYYVSVSPRAMLATYTLPLWVNFSTPVYTNSIQTIDVGVPLKGTVDIVFASNAVDLIAGTINTITLSVSNTGSGTASLISPQVSSSGQMSILNSLSQIAELAPNSTATRTLSVYVPSSILGAAVSIGLSASYYDAYSASHTVTQTLGFYVTSANSTATSVIAMTQVNDSVTDGVLSKVSFNITNVGTKTINSPTFQLSVPSPLVLMSTSSASESSLAPQQTETFTAVVSASPSATPGVYGGTLSVSFTDQSGDQHAQSFPAGFVLNGVVQLIVQDEVISQTSTSLSVSGSLLNEGGVSAYYAEVTGSVKGFPGSNATAYYVGEIDPDNPVSFTISIPLSAPSSARSATILVDVEYQDSFGNSHTSVISSLTSLESADQFLQSQVSTATQTSSDGNLALIVMIVVVAAIVGVGVAGGVIVRRRRAEMRPPKEQKII